MAEPSYYPLSPLRYPIEGTTSPSPDQPLKEDADSSHPSDKGRVSDPPGSHSSTLFVPSRPQLSRRSPSTGRPPLWRTVRTPLKMVLLPLATIGYLAFCYTVHGKVVPVKTYGLYAVTPEHLATIKGGITSISIIIISIALYPVYDIVANLRSEEFFRVLASHGQGVPFETINHVSTPSFGHIDTVMAMWRHACSNYYVLGMVASLLIWIVGILAPGALTIETVMADGELMAFAIGAVPPQSVLNGTVPDGPTTKAGLNSETAASILWAEMELGVQYSFGVANTSESDYAAFIAPVPLDLSTATAARWLSDVIGLNPICSWASTNFTTPLQISSNATSIFNQYLATAYLPDLNLDVRLISNDLVPIDTSSFVYLKDPTYHVKNHTTQAIPADGSTVFLLGQCQGPGCSLNFNVNIVIDLTGVNTTFTIASTNRTWTLAILACKPNITIETREVRNDGHGLLSVQPLPAGRQLTRQRNLNLIQTTALFSIAMKSLSGTTGQLTSNQTLYWQLGSQVQGQLVFGKAQFNALPGLDTPLGTSVTITPAPIENITKGYTQILQSVTKPFLSSYLGTAYVPGRLSTSEVVFAASIPNLAVSTAVFALLAALIVLVHFRSGKGVDFTLANVAAAVHGSELPAQFARIKAEHMDVDGEGVPEAGDAGGEGPVRRADSPGGQQDLVDMFGDRRIYMERRADGSPVLHMS